MKCETTDLMSLGQPNIVEVCELFSLVNGQPYAVVIINEVDLLRHKEHFHDVKSAEAFPSIKASYLYHFVYGKSVRGCVFGAAICLG